MLNKLSVYRLSFKSYNLLLNATFDGESIGTIILIVSHRFLGFSAHFRYFKNSRSEVAWTGKTFFNKIVFFNVSVRAHGIKKIWLKKVKAVDFRANTKTHLGDFWCCL